MNEQILALMGFTPEQWEEFKSNLAFKALTLWQKILSQITLGRIKVLGGAILLVLVVFLGSKVLISVWPRTKPGEVKQPEASPSAVQEKIKFENELEELRGKLENLSEDDPNLLYPSLEVKIEF